MNPSFEYYSGTDEYLWCTYIDNTRFICNWGLMHGYHNSTPNFIHNDHVEGYDFLDDNCDGSDLKPPLTNYVNQGFNPNGIDVTQNGYVGFFTLDYSVSGLEGWREYIGQQLLTPVANGQAVSISFYVSLGDISTTATTLDVGFFNTLPSIPPTAFSTIPVNYGLQVVSVTPVTNRNGWTLVTATWTNNTGLDANYMVIGNFKNNSQTLSSTINPPTLPTMLYGTAGSNPANNAVNCYYLIDDITIERTNTYCCDVPNYVVNPTNPSLPVNFSMVSSYFTQGSSVFVDRPLIIDVNTGLNNVTINFGPNGYIIVNANTYLNIFNGSILRGCDQMWKGIDASAPNAKVFTNNAFIEDAQYAIMSKGGNFLQCINTKFSNNYVGIYLMDDVNMWNISLRKNTFTRYANLKPNNFNITNTYPEAGILLKDAGFVKIGFNGLANRNNFYFMNYGVKSINSNFQLSNAYFNNIRNYDQAGSYSVYMFNDFVQSNIYEATINDDWGSVTFTNSDNGIKSDGLWNLKVNGSRFINLKSTIYPNSYQGYGIYTYGNVPVNPAIGNNTDRIRLNDNTFIEVPYGILLEGCNEIEADIYDNNLTVSETKGSIAIHVVNTSVNAKLPCNTPTCSIYNNLINRYDDAIRAAFGVCLGIEDNTILLNPSPFTQHRGIFLESSHQPRVALNTITGNGTDWRNIGIRLFKTNTSFAYCNAVNTTGYAFWFDEDYNFSYIHHNFITNYQYGMFFVNAAKLGPQYITGTNTKAGKNAWQKQGTSDLEFFVDNSFSPVTPQNSYFYFEQNDNNPYTNRNNINATDQNGNDQFLLITEDANTTGETGPLQYCSGLVQQPGGLAGFVRRRFELGDLPYTGFGTVNEANSRWMFYQNVLQTAKAFEDSLANAQLSPMMENMLDSLQLTDVAGMLAVDEKLQEADFTTALGLNNGVTGTADALDKLKEVHSLLIPHWDSLYHFRALQVTATDVAQLISIANLCPAEYGDAVIKARVFLQLHVNDTLRFMNDCELPVELRQLPRKEGAGMDNKEGIHIYPNPTHDYFIVDLPSDRMLDVNIYSLQGVRLMNRKLTGGSIINIQELAGGVYTVVVNDDEGTLYPPVQLVITQ